MKVYGIPYIQQPRHRRYGFWTFLFDLIMTGLTGGIWLIWLLIKFLRTNSN